MEAVEDRVDLVALELRVDAVLEQRVACGRLEGHDTVVGVTGDLDVAHAFRVDDLVDHGAALGREVVELV